MNNFPTATVLFIILIILMLFAVCSGCASTRVQIDKGLIETNSDNIVAEQTIKPSGEISTKIDTTNQSWWDRLKMSINSAGEWLGNIVGNNTQYSVE